MRKSNHRPLSRTACVLALVAALPGCVSTPYVIGEMSPQPNVLLAPSTQPLALGFGEKVPESLPILVDNHLGGETLQVDRWHETLSRGFHAGFDRYFGKAGTAPAATLVLLGTQPTCACFRGCVATLRYQAELRDPSGAVSKRFAGTVVMPANARWSDDWSHVVELMYEQIAQQMNSGT